MKANETQFHDFLDLEDFYYNDNIDTIYLDPEKTIFFKKYEDNEGTRCVGIGGKETQNRAAFLCHYTNTEIGFVVFLKRVGFDVKNAIAKEKNFKILNKLHKIDKVINLVN